MCGVCLTAFRAGQALHTGGGPCHCISLTQYWNDFAKEARGDADKLVCPVCSEEALSLELLEIAMRLILTPLSRITKKVSPTGSPRRLVSEPPVKQDPSPPPSPAAEECAAESLAPTVAEVTPAVDIGAEIVQCAVCGRPEALDSARSLGTKMETYRCKSSCGANATQLYRELGMWPTPAFNALLVEERMNFMKSLDGLSFKAAAARIRDRLERYEVYEEIPRGRRIFAIVSVKHERFDAESFREKTAEEDRRMHPFFGETFRLRLLAQVSSASRGTKHAVEISASSRGPSSSSGSQQVGVVEAFCCERHTQPIH